MKINIRKVSAVILQLTTAVLAIVTLPITSVTHNLPTDNNAQLHAQAIFADNINDGIDEPDDITYIPDFLSEENTGPVKMVPLTRIDDSVPRPAEQISTKALLSLKETALSNAKQAYSVQSDTSSHNVLIVPSDNINSLIRQNTYSTQNATIRQTSASSANEDISALQKAIKSNQNIACSFLAIRISDGLSVGYNVDREWRCMSTFKAPTALYAYKLASEGNLSLSEKMTYSSKYYCSGSGIIKNNPSGKSYTLNTLLSYSLLHSDNIAYTMLRNRLSADGISKMCRDMGCSYYESALQTWPTVTARDAALWWAEIYKFCRTDPYGSTFYTTLVNATGKIIEKVLDSKYEVAHKGGSGNGYQHDCGIVMAKEPYILVIYTYSKSSSGRLAYMEKIIKEIDNIMTRR